MQLVYLAPDRELDKSNRSMNRAAHFRDSNRLAAARDAHGRIAHANDRVRCRYNTGASNTYRRFRRIAIDAAAARPHLGWHNKAEPKDNKAVERGAQGKASVSFRLMEPDQP